MASNSEFGQVITETEKVTVEYMWTLHNFLTHQESVYEAFTTKSPIFSGPRELDFKKETKWQMKVSNIQYKTNISITLSSLNDFDISLHWQFTIMNNRQPKLVHIFTSSSSSCTYYSTITCTALANDIAKANGQLRVHCRIFLIKENGQWDFQSNLVNSISRLAETQEHSDVILIARDGREHKAHKAILSCRSRVFSAMFEHNMSEKQTNLVNIEDTDSETLNEMLQFIYTGTVKSFQYHKILKLLIAANKYDLNDLEEMCVYYLCLNMNNNNNLNLIEFADTYSISELKQKSTDYFLKNWQEIILAKGFEYIKKLSQDLTQSLLYSLALNQVSTMVSNSEFDQVIIKTEINTVKYKWIIHNFSTLQKSFQEVFTIKSPIFLGPREPYFKKETKWQMEVSKIENEKHISIALSSLNDFEISVYCQFTIMNNHLPKTSCTFKNSPFFCRNFLTISCATLENDIAEANDQLSVYCKIVLIKKGEQRNFQSNLINSISRLVETQEHSDVILITNDEREHKAHKAILSCRSRVFSALFEHNMSEKQTNLVKIEDTDSKTLNEILQFIYTGTIKIFQCDTIQKLLIAADKYDLNDLKEMFVYYLGENINIDNNLDLIELAIVYNISDLKRKSTEFFLKYCKQVILKKGPNCIKELAQHTRDTLLYAFILNHHLQKDD